MAVNSFFIFYLPSYVTSISQQQAGTITFPFLRWEGGKHVLWDCPLYPRVAYTIFFDYFDFPYFSLFF